MSQLQMFGQNIWLLIGILTFLLFFSVALLVGYTSVRAWLADRTRNRSFAEFQARRRSSDGNLRPPQGSGICKQCGDAVANGYYTTAGCVCVSCFDALSAMR